MLQKDLLPKEKQYTVQFTTLKEKGPIELGPTCSHLWRNDPKHLCFLLSRYKFCSKMLAGKNNVLEVGCGDSFGLKLVLQTVSKIHGVDFDPLFINWAKKTYGKNQLNASFQVLDIIKETPEKGPFDGVYALDFIEHIEKAKEDQVMENICSTLTSDAVCILGTPNIAAFQHASKDSKKGHINLKGKTELQNLLKKYFQHVFMFSMNDEVVHTGFSPMAHYLWGVASHPKKSL